MQLRKCLLAIIAIGLPTIGHSHNYAEHVAITFATYVEACNQLEQSLSDEIDPSHNKRRLLKSVCEGNPYVALCQAHMAALAADYIQENGDTPGTTARKLADRYLHNDKLFGPSSGLDCRDLDSLIRNPPSNEDWKQLQATMSGLHNPLVKESSQGNSESCRWAPTLSFVDGKEQVIYQWAKGGKSGLYGTGLFQYSAWAVWDWPVWDWGRLALRNSPHFHPDAPQRSQAAQNASYKADGDRYNARFLAHAFAMHYLEDSYAAGHNGLDRHGKDGRRQDYAHAYHDDLNSAGQFLSIDNKEYWFAFGDGKLCEETTYIELNWQEVTRDKVDHVFSAIATLPNLSFAAKGSADSKLATQLFDDLLSETAKGEDSRHWLALSFPKAIDSEPFFGLHGIVCSFADFCDKAVVVIAPMNYRLGDIDCVEVQSRDPQEGVRILRCPSTARRVFLAALRAQMDFLRRLIDDVQRDEDVEDIITPKFFRSISSTPDKANLLAGQLNNLELLVRYDDQSHCLGADCFGSDCTTGLCNNDIGAKQVSATGLSVATTVGGRHISQSQTVGVSIVPFSLPNGGSGIETQIGVLQRSDTHWRPFEQFAIYSRFFQTDSKEGSLVGVSLLGFGAGVDHIWDGPQRRNLELRVGPELQMEFGRYVFFIRPMLEEQWNQQYRWDTGATLAFGVRIPALKLSPQTLP